MAENQSESSVQNAGQILAEQIEEAIRPLANCVTAVLRVDENNDVELVGSAVLIEVSGEVFFCTAKHVIDLCTTGVFVDAPLKNEALNGNFITSKEHDLVLLKLSPEQVKLFAKYRPLGVHFVGNHVDASQCKYAQFIGFPETKNRKRHGQIDTKGLIYSNGCSVTEVSVTKIRLAFERRHSVTTGSHEVLTAPHPHGMSGGGIFGVPVDLTALTHGFKPKLIGISTDWPKEGEVFGTNIALVMAMIRDNYNVALPPGLNPTHISTAKGP